MVPALRSETYRPLPRRQPEASVERVRHGRRYHRLASANDRVGDPVVMIDQRKLPSAEVYCHVKDGTAGRQGDQDGCNSTFATDC